MKLKTPIKRKKRVKGIISRSRLKTLYHLSPISERESILKNGLDYFSYFGDEVRYKTRLFLFRDLNNPPFNFVSFSSFDIWTVKISAGTMIFKDIRAYKAGFKNCFYIKKGVSKENISLIKTIE